MQRLHDCGVAAVLPGLKQPVLGICLGMQLLFRHSEEGDTACLGIIPETVRRLRPSRVSVSSINFSTSGSGSGAREPPSYL